MANMPNPLPTGKEKPAKPADRKTYRPQPPPGRPCPMPPSKG